MGRFRSLPLALLLSAGCFLIVASRAEAIPSFAHEYGFSCQRCHTVVPHLSEFGQAFLDHGNQIPGVAAHGSPLSARANLVYSSDPEGTPKAIVDEIEVFLAGKAGPQTSYFFEQYLVDGGFPGSTRDAWVNQRLTSWRSPFGASLQAGQFTLPLPVDPETFRDTYQDYALYSQAVGANPFNFFDPKIGADARFNLEGGGPTLNVAALEGHDRQSGLPSRGTDYMLSLAQPVGRGVSLWGYRYEGRRPGTVDDEFWRLGYGATYTSSRWESQVILQTGNDSSADGLGAAASSSGGFGQLRYTLGNGSYFLARYEGTSDSVAGVSRDFVALFGHRFSHNTRFTLEDVIQHVPQTKNTLNAQFTIAY